MLINLWKYSYLLFKFNYKIIVTVFILIALSSCTSTVRYSSEIKGSNENLKEKYASEHTITKDKISEKQEKVEELKKFRGYASFYSDKFNGQKTSSGEIYDKDKLTAAHPDLPFGTIVEVRNLTNNKKIRVRINDRGPFISGRIIDLSRSAAEAIGMIQTGIVEVEITIISIP